MTSESGLGQQSTHICQHGGGIHEVKPAPWCRNLHGSEAAGTAVADSEQRVGMRVGNGHRGARANPQYTMEVAA